MISNDYQNVADWLAGFALRWQPLEPLQCAHLAQVLLDLADRVKHLEEIPLRLDSPEVRLGFHQMQLDDDQDCLT